MLRLANRNVEDSRRRRGGGESLRAVTFDLTHTLIHSPRVAEIYGARRFAGRRFGPGIALTLLAGSFAAACGEPATETRDVPTIDVPPPLTVETERDPQAVAQEPKLVGVLPGGFPEDLPLYLPSSLIDFESGDYGLDSVTLISAHPVSRVRGALRESLQENGWMIEAGEAEAVMSLRKGSRRVELRLEDGAPGTVYRFEYQRRGL